MRGLYRLHIKLQYHYETPLWLGQLKNIELKETQKKMGNGMPIFASLYEGVFDNPANSEVNIMMLSLTGAGKSTILKQLWFGKIITTIATIGFSFETVAYKNLWIMHGMLEGMTKYDLCDDISLISLMQSYLSLIQPIIWNLMKPGVSSKLFWRKRS